jgi:hypothetical protein
MSPQEIKEEVRGKGGASVCDVVFALVVSVSSVVALLMIEGYAFTLA